MQEDDKKEMMKSFYRIGVLEKDSDQVNWISVRGGLRDSGFHLNLDQHGRN